jgi:hypothetical protein
MVADEGWISQLQTSLGKSNPWHFSQLREVIRESHGQFKTNPTVEIGGAFAEQIGSRLEVPTHRRTCIIDNIKTRGKEVPFME